MPTAQPAPVEKAASAPPVTAHEQAQPPAPTEKSIPQPKPKSIPQKKATKSKLGKLANLSSLKEAVKIANQSKKEEVKEEKKQYSIQQDIHIDLDAFQFAMEEYLALLKQSNKHNLVSILEASKHTFTHNCWHLTVPEFAGLVERNQEMLPFFRKKLNQPNLYAEIKVGAAFVNPNDTRPYTEEEKLKEMGHKNPALLELQKKFKTRIIY